MAADTMRATASLPGSRALQAGNRALQEGKAGHRDEKLEAAARKANKKSETEMQVHGRWGLSTTLPQVATALSAIALLTRKTWLLYGVFAAAGIGVGFGVMGFLHM